MLDNKAKLFKNFFSSILPITAGLFSIGFGVIGVMRTLLVILGVALISFGMVYFRIKKPQFDPTAIKTITLRYADEDEMADIAKLDKNVFPPEDYISKDIFIGWHQKNKMVFKILLYKEKLVGYYSILPLTQDALDAFTKGYLRDKDIKPKDILTKNQTKKCESLYLFSVVLHYRRHLLIRELLEDIADTLEKIRRNMKLKKIYATAASPAGEKLLKKFKFKKMEDKSKRADQHSLYCKDLSHIESLKEYFNECIDRQ